MGRGRITLFIAGAFFLIVMGPAPLCADHAAGATDDNAGNAPGGNYVHNYTGFTFPLTVGVFKRMRVTSYNATSSDIGIDYNNEPYTAHVSVNVYPAKGPLQPHYEECRDQVVQVHPDAKLAEEKPVTLNKAGARYDGYSALFTFHGQFVSDTPQELLSRLIVFRYGDYFVTYRVSYAEDNRAATEKLIDDFIQKLDWPPPSPSGGEPTPSPAPSPVTPTPSTSNS